jgi:predicted PhzF superfamily epimerase YddE/YHI9
MAARRWSRISISLSAVSKREISTLNHPFCTCFSDGRQFFLHVVHANFFNLPKMKVPFELIAVFDDPDLPFRGNTSAVIFLETPIDESLMQPIAANFNQPATTFLWLDTKIDTYHVRWFAPDAEIELCGHGALAAIAFLCQNQDREVRLLYRKGYIDGKSEEDDFFSINLAPIPVTRELEISDTLKKGLGVPIKAHYQTNNKNIVLLESEADLRRMQPDFARLRESAIFGYAVTAKGEEADFVSRTLVPHVQQLEDHATGSSHAALVPFWRARLGREELVAHQLSPRRGRFLCQYDGYQVRLSGHASFPAGGKIRL